MLFFPRTFQVQLDYNGGYLSEINVWFELEHEISLYFIYHQFQICNMGEINHISLFILTLKLYNLANNNISKIQLLIFEIFMIVNPILGYPLACAGWSTKKYDWMLWPLSSFHTHDAINIQMFWQQLVSFRQQENLICHASKSNVFNVKNSKEKLFNFEESKCIYAASKVQCKMYW